MSCFHCGMTYAMLFWNKFLKSIKRDIYMPISRTTNPGIRIEESSRDRNYGKKTASALQQIKQGSSGRKLLDDISHYSSGGKKTVTIRDAGPHGAVYTRPESGGSSSGFWPFTKSKKGSSASTHWSPDQGMSIDSSGKASRVPGNSEDSFISLGHELVHAKNIMRGTDAGYEGSRTDPSTPLGMEEWRAIGLGEYYNRSPSENSIRTEHGKTLRTSSEQATSVSRHSYSDSSSSS